MPQRVLIGQFVYKEAQSVFVDNNFAFLPELEKSIWLELASSFYLLFFCEKCSDEGIKKDHKSIFVEMIEFLDLLGVLVIEGVGVDRSIVDFSRYNH